MKQWKPVSHSGAPLNLQWSLDSKMIRTFNKNYEVMHFKLLKKKKKVTFDPKIADPGLAFDICCVFVICLYVLKKWM